MSDSFAYVSDDSPQGLAQLWCFYCTRRKFRTCRDLPEDIAPEMANLMDNCGLTALAIRNEILRKGRDRGEYMWQFKQRFGLGLPIRSYAQLAAPQTQHYKPEPPLSQEERDKAAETWKRARGLQ